MLTRALYILESGTSEAVCEITLGTGRYACRAMSLLRHEYLIATKAAALVFIKPVPASPADTMNRRFGLTDAEIKVSIGISKGRSVKQIAEDHRVRAETVRAQLKSTYNKIEVYTRAQLVAFVRDLPDAPDMPDGT